MDDKRRLLGFFAAKEHTHLVFRIVDILELSEPNLVRAVALVVMQQGGIIGADPRDMKGWLLRLFPSGFIALEIERMLSTLSLADLEQVQEVVAEYRDIRMGKGEPCRKEACPECMGNGCDNCQDGSIYVFTEMSDEEAQLACGGQ